MVINQKMLYDISVIRKIIVSITYNILKLKEYLKTLVFSANDWVMYKKN